LKTPKFWGLHAEPSLGLNWFLLALPFILLVVGYLTFSHVRRLDNPDDKIAPSVTKMVDSVYRIAFTKDTRSGAYLMVKDTVSSLKRITVGIWLAAITGLLIGLNLGMFPGFRALLLPFFTFLSIIPPLTLLPILFIAFGVDETAKIVLIFIGICPTIIRDVYLTTEKAHKEHKVKALTLGASQLGVVYRVILPQIVPRWLDATRLALGPAWLFLIAAEAIASTDGLGYRIFLMRRYLDMSTIIPYVLWITTIGFLMDWALRAWVAWRYPWYTPKK